MTESPGDGARAGFPADVTTLSEVLPDGLVVADREATLVFANSRAGRVLGIDLGSRMGLPLAQAVPLRDSDGRPWWEVADPWGALHIVKGHREKLLWTEDGVEVLVTARYVRVGRRGPVELRSTLTSVKGFSTTLLRRWDRFTDDQKRFMIETIETDADRVTRLITELLDVSRIDAGRLDVRPQPVDVASMAMRHAERLRAQDDHAGRPVVVTADDDLPEVWADPDRLNQILANLLENGLRHGAGTVRVGVARAPEAGSDGRSQVEVWVTDEGEGVADAHLPLIFNRFWHGQRRGSTGLGLYVVRGLVEAHGGQISVDRAEGGGARFRFTLPSGPPEHLA